MSITISVPKSLVTEEQKNTHDEGRKLRVNERRSQVRKLIDIVTSLYTPLLREHTKQTKLKRDLAEKDDSFIDGFK